MISGVQERYSLVGPAESNVLSSINMNIETFGNLVHNALQKVHVGMGVCVCMHVCVCLCVSE